MFVVHVFVQVKEEKIEDFKKFWSKHLTLPNDIPLYERELENWGGKIQTTDVTLKTFKKRYPCRALWVIIMIDTDGNAYPCCEALSDRENSNLLLGNIIDNTIKEIYSSEKYRNIKNLHLSGDWRRIPECVNCDFWSSSRDIWFRTKKGFK